jgi:hypothetical protein
MRPGVRRRFTRARHFSAPSSNCVPRATSRPLRPSRLPPRLPGRFGFLRPPPERREPGRSSAGPPALCLRPRMQQRGASPHEALFESHPVVRIRGTGRRRLWGAEEFAAAAQPASRGGAVRAEDGRDRVPTPMGRPRSGRCDRPLPVRARLAGHGLPHRGVDLDHRAGASAGHFAPQGRARPGHDRGDRTQRVHRAGGGRSRGAVDARADRVLRQHPARPARPCGRAAREPVGSILPSIHDLFRVGRGRVQTGRL